MLNIYFEFKRNPSSRKKKKLPTANLQVCSPHLRGYTSDNTSGLVWFGFYDRISSSIGWPTTHYVAQG